MCSNNERRKIFQRPFGKEILHWNHKRSLHHAHPSGGKTEHQLDALETVKRLSVMSCTYHEIFCSVM